MVPVGLQQDSARSKLAFYRGRRQAFTSNDSRYERF